MEWKVGEYVYDLGKHASKFRGDVGVIIKIIGDMVYIQWLKLANGTHFKKGDYCESITYVKNMDRKYLKMEEKEVILELL